MQPQLLHYLRYPKKRIKPLLMLMLAAAPFADSYSAYSQALKHVVPGMEVKKGSLLKAINLLEEKGDVKISYDRQALSGLHISSNAWKNESVSVILSQLLRNTGLHFEERQNTILIYPSPVATATTPASGTQERRITGRVTDVNGPLPGAVIQIKGSNKGAITDDKGNFSIPFSGNSDAVLLVSMIGYKTQEVTVNGESPVSIRMESNSRELSQVVVVGYGSQSKSKITGAVTDVKLDKLTSRSVANVQEALQGKAPGVVVQNQGGDPTSTPKVTIRGIGGINGEIPLYVVDGVIFDGPINPADIESISVLKDAAAAIYGARASGGVILITTKKGKSGGMSVSLNAKYGVQEAWKKLKVLNAQEFNDVMNKAYDNAGKPRNPAYDATVNPDGAITRTNWVDEVLRSGKIQDYNIDIASGTDKSKYFMGFGYRKAEGILINTYTERYNFRLNSEHELKPWLKIGENMSYTYTNGNGANTTSAYTGALLVASYYTPSVTPYQPDGTFSGLPKAFAGAYGDVINPVAYLMRLDNKRPESQLLINPYIEIQLPADLRFRSNFALNKRFTNRKEFESRRLEIGKIFDQNSLYTFNENYNDILAEQTLTYDKQLGVHHVNAVAGFTFQKKTVQHFNVMVTNFDDERNPYRYPQNGGNIDRSTGNTEGARYMEALQSWLGRVNYDYKGKYLFSALGRRDGSSLVAPHNRYEFYYALSGGWVITNEIFASQLPVVNYLKLRGSYGTLGNLSSVTPSALLPPLISTQSYFGQESKPLPGYAESAFPNPDLQWANSDQLNIGLDAGFFENKLSLNADYFIKNTNRMLREVPPQGTDGVTKGKWQNIGQARDKGFELGLTWNAKTSGDFQYSIGANITTVKNELISLGGVKTLPTSDINIRSSITPVAVMVGQPLYSYYLVKTAGIFQTQEEVDNYTAIVDGQKVKIQPKAQPGDLKFVDSNGDGKIDNKDRVISGSAYPKFTYGFSFNASYKGFDLNLFAQGVYGNKLFNGVKFTGLAPLVTGQGYNLLADVKNAWTPENRGSNIPRLSTSDPNGNFGTTSDWYLENGSYLRIKNLTLGYSLPDALAQRAGLSKVRVYVTGNNLLTFTKYTGMDPEVGTDTYGIDLGRYPQARSFLVGLNVNF